MARYQFPSSSGGGAGGGTTWYSGSAAPSTLHNDGDFYLRTSNGDVYKQVSGAWGSPIENLTGPAGAAGSTGAAGTDAVVAISVKTGDYTVLVGDKATLFIMNSSSAHTFTLPGTVPSNGWHVYFASIGTGTVTISRNGHNIDGAASDLTLTQFQGLMIGTDATNYFTDGHPAASGGSGVSSLNSLTGALSIVAGTGITVTPSGSNITIDASGGGGSARTTASITTASLANNAIEASTVTLSKAFGLLKIVALVSCRIRLYSTTGARDADSGRPPDVSPDDSRQHGVICDIVLNALTGLTWILNPTGYGCDAKVSPDGVIGYNITNSSGVTQTVGVTITYLPEES